VAKPRDGDTVNQSRSCGSARQSPGDLFDPVETELLRLYFGEGPTLDRSLLLQDAADAEDTEDTELDEPRAHDAAFGVRLEEVEVDSNQDDTAVARAVARICLHVIGRRPPRRAGPFLLETLTGAALDLSLLESPIAAPHLFTIDWCMGSWPESYFAVLVPGFDRFVVVKTSDHECCGGAWLALGWFDRGQDGPAEIGRIVRDWWGFQARHGQDRWESFWRDGVFTESVAARWADDVWPAGEETEEDEDDGERSDELEASDGVDEDANDAGLTP
jgi:hypothetical protein